MIDHAKHEMVRNDPRRAEENQRPEGELVGYQQTTETTLDYSPTPAPFAKTVHKFFTNSWDPVGREYETLYQNASGSST
ncbi:MAG TPA: hypothetical protein VFS61_13510, partial [Anaerolineales bacterium]|nr:hypothetical protein [Anaerolineales bacterium]